MRLPLNRITPAPAHDLKPHHRFAAASLIAAFIVVMLLPMATDAAPKKGKGKAAGKKMVPLNLARGKKATASSLQGGHTLNGPLDGNLETRWCASDGSFPQWWQVDLGKPEDLTGCRIRWEQPTKWYQYTIDGSTDGKTWKTLLDHREKKVFKEWHEHKLSAKGVRYVRLNIEAGHGGWASLWEFEAFGDAMITADKQTYTNAPAKNKGNKKQGNKKGGPLPTLNDVKAPEGFEVTLFGVPPKVNYPVCLTTTPDGVVFIGVDPNGSLGKTPGRGHVTRAIDTDGDGVADDIKVFTKVQHPRGVYFDNNKLWVLHPPDITLYHDDDGDGVADREELLVKGISTPEFNKQRGADHTTNGIRIGIDGWMYIAVGDFGFMKATDKSGKDLQLLGGGVARVRLDGTELEVYARGLRNICDIAIDPLLNGYTRDNTNDGGGWNVRVSHIVQSGNYGYPSLYKNFADELLEPMHDYGGGSGTGALYIAEPTLPKPFNDAMLTIDWGRGGVYFHPLTKKGASFTEKQEDFIKLPRPTDADVDANGNLYVGSWKNGRFSYGGENVGFVAMVKPKGAKPKPFPDLNKASKEDLVKLLGSASHVTRLYAQRELLRREPDSATIAAVERLASHESAEVRVAAIFTLKQWLGEKSHATLLRLTESPATREHALRALADRKSQVKGVPTEPFVKALGDSNPRVRVAAAVGLGRLGKPEAASALLPLTHDEDPIVAHVAVKALVALQAVDACLAAVNDASTGKANAMGALRALRELHTPAAVDGLIAKASQVREPELRREVFTTLIRLHHREGEWKSGWWGTRPDTRGPYYRLATWEQSEAIAKAVSAELAKGDAATRKHLIEQLLRHRVQLGDMKKSMLEIALKDAGFVPAFAAYLATSRQPAPEQALPMLRNVLTNKSADTAARRDATAVLLLSKDEASYALAVRTLARDSARKGDRESQRMAQDLVRDRGNANRVAFFAGLTLDGDEHVRGLAYATLLHIAAEKRHKPEVRSKANAVISAAWATPKNAATVLEQLASHRVKGFNDQVTRQLSSADKDVRKQAVAAAKALRIPTDAKPREVIAKISYDKVLAAMLKTKGKPKLGEQLFTQVGCANCHTMSLKDPPKGPMLGGIGKRYNRKELTESILKPSATVAQGFETNYIETDFDQLLCFVTREAGDEIETRDAAGTVRVIKKSDIVSRQRRKQSIMPEGLVANLTLDELASLLAYLESTKSE